MRNRSVSARFDGGDLSSDGGAILLAEAERSSGIIGALARSVVDMRQSGKVTHSVLDMVRARVFGICAGYEDANDLDSLRSDPVFKLACDRLPASGGELASQPSIMRLENSVNKRDVVRAAHAMARVIVAGLPAGTSEVILDVDATPDPCHGQQELEGFNAHYDVHCYLPLLLHVSAGDGRKRLLAALLRPGNVGTFQGLRALIVGGARQCSGHSSLRAARSEIRTWAEQEQKIADPLQAHPNRCGVEISLGRRWLQRVR